LSGIHLLRKVIFLDDFFRTEANGVTSHPSNIRWLAGAFSPLLRSVGGSGWVLDSTTVVEQVSGVMTSLGLPASPAGWAQCFANPLPALLHANFSGLSDATLAIGFGLSPSLLDLLDRQGTPVLDFEIAPVRFCHRLFFGCRTNVSSLATALSRISIQESEFRQGVAKVTALAWRLGPSNWGSTDLRVGLFCGQTKVDAALVQAGRLESPGDHIDEVKRIAEHLDVLLIRPHPFEPSIDHLIPILKEVRNSILLQTDTYSLLAAENVQIVVGLSSSVLFEAAYFFKQVHQIISPDGLLSPLIPKAARKRHWVDERVLEPKFWQSVNRFDLRALTRRRVTVKPCSDFVGESIGARWGGSPRGIQQPLIVELDRTYRFSEGLTARGALTWGWDSAPEAWGGVWSIGSLASILVDIGAPCARRSKFAFELEYRQYWPLDKDETAVRFSSSQAASFRLSKVERSDGPPTRTVTMLLHTARLVAGRFLQVFIEIAQPRRPIDWGDGADVRALGVAAISITLRSLP
jgi:hypothetical protein